MDAHPDHLDTVIAATDRTIATISDDQLSFATPCADWDVRALLEHVITGNRAFAAALRPDAAVAAAPVSGSASGLLESYRDSAAQVTAGFRLEGALTRMVTVPFGTVPGAVALHLRLIDVLVHGWDLAQASGQTFDCAPELAEQELTFTRGALADLPPDRTPFGPAQPVTGDAPAIDRLAGYLGRVVPVSNS